MIWLVATLGTALAGAPSLDALAHDVTEWNTPTMGWRVGEHIAPADLPYFLASLDYAASIVIVDDPSKQKTLDKIHKKYRIKGIDPAANLLSDPAQMHAALLSGYGDIKTPLKAAEALWNLVVSIRPPNAEDLAAAGTVVVRQEARGPVLVMQENVLPIVQIDGMYYIDLPDPFAEPPPPVEDPRPIDHPDRIPTYYAQLAPGAVVELDGTEPSVGPADAVYTVVEYLDYFCMHCAKAAAAERELFQNEHGVRFVYKAYPLTMECNPAVGQSDMPFRCAAAAAAECAHQQGQFEVTRQALFSAQEVLMGMTDPAQVREIVGEMEVDLGRYDACIADPATQQSIVADAQAGARAGVNGTPAHYLKGPFGDQWVEIRGNVEQLMVVIDAHRKGATLPPPAPAPAE